MKIMVKLYLLLLEIFIICILEFLPVALLERLIDNPSFKLVFFLGAVLLLQIIFKTLNKYHEFTYKTTLQTSHIEKLFNVIIRSPLQAVEEECFQNQVHTLKDKEVLWEKYWKYIEAIISFVVTVGLFLCIAINDLNWEFILFFLLLLTSCFAISYFVHNRLALHMYDFWKKHIEYSRLYNYHSDVLSQKKYLEERKIYRYEAYFSKNFITEFEKANNNKKQLGQIRLFWELLNTAVHFFFLLLSQFMFTYIYLESSFTTGKFIALFCYIELIANKLLNVTNHLNGYKHYHTFIQDSLSFFNRTIPSSTFLPTETISASLATRNLYFSYINFNKNVLNNITLNFEKGKKYAVVGKSGCGKTTLAKVLAGLYQPTSGIVEARSKPVVLFQDFNKFGSSLFENITLCESSTYSDNDLSRVNHIIDIIGLRNKVEILNQKGETPLGSFMNGGEDLSGGEWQRVALGRILWINPEIVILDEPTANLDPLEEVKFFNLYAELLSKKTIIYITHRLGAIKDVDSIFLLEDGIICESGTHFELMQIPNGKYKSMYEEQCSWYEKE